MQSFDRIIVESLLIFGLTDASDTDDDPFNEIDA